MMVLDVNGDNYAKASDGKTYSDFLGNHFCCYLFK